MRPKKAKTQKAVRTTVSMPLTMLVGAMQKQQQRGLTNFSAYVQSLIHRDQQTGAQHQEAA